MDLLQAAGVDYVLLDGTNFGPYNFSEAYGGDPLGDVRQTRPFEVVFEEWAKLRARGEGTPQLAVWNRVNAQTNSSAPDNVWRVVLDRLYNNQSYADLLWRDRHGKKIFFLVDSPKLNESAALAIASNSGRNDVLTVRAWLATDGPNSSTFTDGVWTYFSGCVAQNSAGQLVFDNTILHTKPCQHRKTTNSPLGSQWTVSMAEVLGNVPFGNGGKLRGLFFKKQMEDVFQDNSADFLFTPSFNEIAITPIPMSRWGIQNPYYVGAGMVNEDDWYRRTIWLDGFGTHRSRSIEPSVEDHGRYYELYCSCVRVARLGRLLDWSPRKTRAPDATPCDVVGEQCCTIDDDQLFTPVWSMERTLTDDVVGAAPQSDRRLALQDEVDALRSEYTEVCVPDGSSHGANGEAVLFCVDSDAAYLTPDKDTATKAFAAARGPFYALTKPLQDGTRQLWRCVTKTRQHFVANTSLCDGLGKPERLLGHTSSLRNSHTPRLLRRCTGEPGPTQAHNGEVGHRDAPQQGFYHVLDISCFDGTRGVELGFVV